MSSILRAAPPLSRAFSASAMRAAATAPSTSAAAAATSSKATTTSSYYSSRYARAPTAAATGSGYKRAAYTKAPAAAAAAPAPSPARAAPAPAAAAPAPTPAPAAAAPQDYAFDDLDDADFRLPDTQIEDYAHLRKSAARAAAPARARAAANTPSASPPLTDLPDESYVPLPSAAPDSSASPPPAPSAPGAIGSARLQDGYVFTAGRLPGELVSDDWTTSFRGLSERPFPKEAADALLRPLSADDVEIKPDGLLYLPEIKYRRTLNAAFGPGGWGMAPRGETHVGPRIVSREWGLVCLGRLVAIARGEQEYFDPSGVPTATEACKSNALMRCCKDLGIGSELWDPRFIREFKAKHCVEAMVEHVTQKRKRKLWRKKENKFEYPYREISAFSK